jgi:hypothetical protein
VPAPTTFTDAELGTVLDAHRTRHAKTTHRAFAECTLAPCVEIDQLSREAFAQRVSRQPGAGYVARPAGSAFATAAADAMQAVGNPPNAAALDEVAHVFSVHARNGELAQGAHVPPDFADCTHIGCATVTRAMRYIFANSSAGLRLAIITHALNEHGPDFWTCDRQPCASADPGNREQYAATVRIDTDEHGVELKTGDPNGVPQFYGGPGQSVHIAADGATVHQGRAAECTASGCMRARAGRDDSMADMAAAEVTKRLIDELEAAWNVHGEHKPTDGPSSFESCDLMPCYGLPVADRVAFASERGEPNDPHREG